MLVSEVVSVATYRAKREGRKHFEAAVRDGFSYSVARQPRETVGLPTSPRVQRASMLQALALGNKAFSLKVHGQYANGVLESGNEFVPVWTSADAARAWLPHFPEHRVVALNAQRALRLLADAASADEFFYIGLGTNVGIVTFHPVDLLEGMEGISNPTPA